MPALKPGFKPIRPRSLKRLRFLELDHVIFKFYRRGEASFYGERFHGNLTASRERYNMYDYTCAHLTLPFGTMLTVKSVACGRTVVVRVNDRGPHVPGRIIDLSTKAARDLGLIDKGHEMVELYLK